jgi:hypothetical protein
MSARRNKSTVLVAGLLLFAVVQSTAAGQETAANATDQPQLRTWTNRTGTHRTEAVFVESKDGKVSLKKKDGTIVNVPLESLSDADQVYVQQRAADKEQSIADPATTPRKPTPQAPSSSTFTNKKTGETFKGKILKREEVDGQWRFLVEGEDGQQAWIRIHQWKITHEKAKNAAAQSSDGPDGQSDDPSEATDPSVVEINPSTSTEAKLMSVVVTGVGPDPDKAVQNAFSQAIEQTVGVLVDAETVVENDQLIRDDILTYSRGYVEKYEIVKPWEEGGLHHATIRAVVARDKLVEKLRGMKIAMQEVGGDLASRQIEFDVKNEEQAAEIFRKALADFDMTKLTKVEIVGKPEITREGANAKVRIRVRVAPDLDQWQKLSPALRTILVRTATRRASYILPGGYNILPGGYTENELARRQLEGQGALVALLANVIGDRTRWEVFRVPAPMEAAIEATVSQMQCRLACVLLDEQGKEITRTVDHVRSQSWVCEPVSKFKHDLGAWFIGPTWWNMLDGHHAVIDLDRTIDISSEDLRRVAKTAAFLEEDTKKR